MSFTAASRQIIANVWLNNSTTTAKVNSVRYQNAVNENRDRLLPGCAACGSVEIVLDGEYTEDLTGQKVEVGFNAFVNGVEGDATIGWLGVFYITEQESVKGSGFTTIYAADVVSKMDGEDYISSLSYPAAASAVLGEIARTAGVNIYWDTPGNDISNSGMAAIMVQEKPVGYTCREVLGYIAGLYGRFAIDSLQAWTSGLKYADSVVLKDYTAEGRSIPSSIIYRDGVTYWTQQEISETPVVYVESTLVETGGVSAQSGDYPLDNVGYLQNPDELADVVYDYGYYTPYWIIIKPPAYSEDNPYYEVFFFDSIPTFYFYYGSFIKTLSFCTDCGSYNFGDSMNNNNGYDWNEVNGTNKDFEFELGFYKSSTQTVVTEDDLHIVGASFDVYLDDGTLLFAANASEIGALRGGGEVMPTYEIEYGIGDYTNPLVSAENLEGSQAQQLSHTYHPGEVKWRGDPTVRVGTAVTLKDNTPFLISSIELYYDGGMYSIAECHGSTENFDKNPGLRRQLKQLRGAKKLWAATQEVTS